MAIKVSLEGNILNIDDGVSITPLTAAWVSESFTADTVYLRNNAKPANSALKNPYPILFTEFQDGAGTPINTEATISTYLSDKIG